MPLLSVLLSRPCSSVDSNALHSSLHYFSTTCFAPSMHHVSIRRETILTSLLLQTLTMTLLDHIRALVEAERGLTDVIERTAPLLPHSLSSTMSSSSSHIEPPLLPTPRTIDEVPTILAVARAYAHRTSAPPMWDPSLPVIGFATPNPLPHQLRGGALGAMQLKLERA